MSRLLAEQVRAGKLSRERLHIGALLGDPSAKRVADDAPDPPRPGVPVGRAKRGKVKHGLRTSMSLAPAVGFPDVRYDRTFCGRETGRAKPEALSGAPTCRSCLRSDWWRDALAESLGELVAKIGELDPRIGFKCAVMSVEHVMVDYLASSRRNEDAAPTRRFAEFALWGSGALQGPPPPPRDDPRGWDPVGLFDEGASAWVYGLACSARDVHDGAPSLGVTLRSLMKPVTAWCLGTGDGRKLVEKIIANLQTTVLPFVLGRGEDPLIAVAVHYREVAARLRRRERFIETGNLADLAGEPNAVDA